MSELYTPPKPRRYTEKDLCDAARSLGCDDVERRTVRTFVELGLLDHPQRTWPGRGGGSSQGSWSSQQFDLWRTLLRQRKQLIARYGRKTHIHAALCNVVVAAWLYFGEEAGVSLAQAQRAMRTWAKAHAIVGSDVEARRLAKQFVRLAAHASADNRRTLREYMAQMLYNGRYPERDELLYQMGTLVDPHNRGEIKGPAEAPISALNLTDMILGRAEMLEKLGHSMDTPSDGLWEWARFILLFTRNWYQDTQPRLADDPSLRKHPELAQIYGPTDFESMMNAACQDVLSVLGAAKLAQHATHLPLEQRPDPWLAGQVHLKVEGRERHSALLYPDGSRQIYVELAAELIWHKAGTPANAPLDEG